MITIIIIVIVIIVVVNISKSSKPDKYNIEVKHTAIKQYPAFTIYGKNLSKMDQLSEVILSEHVIVSFVHNNGHVDIRFKDGGFFSAALSEMSVTFMYTKKRRIACLKAHGQEKWIQEARTLMTENEWDQIFNLLILSGETYYADTISKKSREETDALERVSKVYKINRFLNG